ncbi:hypothetical protein [Paenibacillus apis]|uniref:Uncharacterized protein n=1 Tax=Paenibacillus apis TaxID=1792174 RepID=A0A919Y5I6_9BACL|nr:hypothetical protein [Paenibacillus apis]GIO42765.1 hypothetical protein J41TS4_25230 [Paenibacillus apis]
MKIKVAFSILLLILLASIGSMVYYNINYKTFDEAISESNVSIDEVFHTTDYKGHTIIFYGERDTLSVGLIEKTLFGYRWSIGVGSKMFNEENQRITSMFSNLHPREIRSDDDLVPLVFGIIYDDSIDKIKIKYKDQNITEATIIETSKGRIWYCFSDTPINYDPEVQMTYRDGTAI